MFNTRSLLSFFRPRSSADSCEVGAGSVQDLLSKEKIGILSASCCDATTQAKDEQLAANLSSAMEKAGVEHQVVLSTITSTRQQLRDLGAEVGDDVKIFKENLAGLFQGQGLAAFPILLVNGKIAFYGGVPSVEMIVQKLQSPPPGGLK